MFDGVTAHHVSFILQEEQLQSSERDKLSKNREPIADVQQQLRQKVDALVFDGVTAHHVCFILQEEQLQSSEREKLSKNIELADAQQQLRQKVKRHCDSFCAIIPITAGSRADKKGSRADKGRGDYQKRAAADSGDETES